MSVAAESNAAKAHARIVYLGSVSPHWEVYGDWGDRQLLDEFRARVLARLVLLPREDPQFRRNRERIVRDAERELITIEWDLGVITQAHSSFDMGDTPDSAPVASSDEVASVDADAASPETTPEADD
jgi:hypothetical protein